MGAAALLAAFFAEACLITFLAVATALRAFAATASCDGWFAACLDGDCWTFSRVDLFFLTAIACSTHTCVRVPTLRLADTRPRGDSVPAICQNQTMKLVARFLVITISLLSPSLGWGSDSSVGSGAFRVLNSWPHAIEDSTQGLEFVNDQLLESTGRYGKSRILLRDWRTGQLIESYPLPAQFFGEGVTRVGERFWQLSWRSGRGWIYDRQLQPVARFSYAGQGWGLCYDGERLIRSDGSDRLFFHSIEDFSVLGSVLVQLDGQPLKRINELECVDGTVYANLWQSDWLVQIDPRTGEVIRRWDLESLRYRFRPPPSFSPTEDVLNGIAFHPQRGSFFVTGKRWPVLFEIALDPNGGAQNDRP